MMFHVEVLWIMTPSISAVEYRRFKGPTSTRQLELFKHSLFRQYLIQTYLELGFKTSTKP